MARGGARPIFVRLPKRGRWVWTCPTSGGTAGDAAPVWTVSKRLRKAKVEGPTPYGPFTLQPCYVAVEYFEGDDTHFPRESRRRAGWYVVLGDAYAPGLCRTLPDARAYALEIAAGIGDGFARAVEATRPGTDRATETRGRCSWRCAVPDGRHDGKECGMWNDAGRQGCASCGAAQPDATAFRCAACLDGEVVNDTCDDCGERHCPACEPCEDAAFPLERGDGCAA